MIPRFSFRDSANLVPRQRKRPIIFIGHGFGVLLIKQVRTLYAALCIWRVDQGSVGLVAAAHWHLGFMAMRCRGGRTPAGDPLGDEPLCISRGNPSLGAARPSAKTWHIIGLMHGHCFNACLGFDRQQGAGGCDTMHHVVRSTAQRP